MNKLSIFLFICSFIILLACLIWFVYLKRRNGKLLDRLNQMLDKAMAGDFSEEYYDETKLAKVETKMAQYLASSASSAWQLKTEKQNISKLISDISHQMKTPIANLLIYSELLMEYDEGAARQEYVKAMKGQSEKLKFLADALVKLSRMEAGIISPQVEKTAVYPMLEEAVNQIRSAAEKKMISISLLPTEITAVIDGKWTGEAIFNLLDNAVKYTPAGGAVTISTASYELFYRIDIQDNGAGICENESTKIFRRFYRGQNARSENGVGIGLYLVREIIAAQGGYIKLKSEPNKGSTFSVFLPIS